MNNDKRTTRELAIEFWSNLTIEAKRELTDKYHSAATKEHGRNRAYLQISNWAIEHIYLSEHPTETEQPLQGIKEEDELYFLKDAKPYCNSETYGKHRIAVIKNGNVYCVVESNYPHETMQNARDIIANHKAAKENKSLRESNESMRADMKQMFGVFRDSDRGFALAMGRDILKEHKID